MLILKEAEVCPHSGQCRFNVGGSCQGANPKRKYAFECVYVEDGIIKECGDARNPCDLTGKMKPIMETS